MEPVDQELLSQELYPVVEKNGSIEVAYKLRGLLFRQPWFLLRIVKFN